MEETFTVHTDHESFADLLQYGQHRRGMLSSGQSSPQLQQVPIYPVNTRRSRNPELPTTDSFDRTSTSVEVQHASPLAPLRERDAAALEEFFDHDRIQEVTLDIHRYLARMYPEPCWEDEPYEFLQGYV